jgi:NADH dehydrogenase
MRLLVTGASGFIGSAFCSAARGAGNTVTALVRPRPREMRYPDGDVVFGSLPFDLPARALEGIDAVVHCAGATMGQDAAESAAITAEGTRCLLAGAKERGIARFVFLSSQSAHEGAVSAYGRTKLKAEAFIRESGIPHAILRPGLVFGPGPVGLFARMRAQVNKLPVLPLLGGGIAAVQPIEVGDLCAAMLKCLALPDGESVELNLGEPEAMKLRDFLQAIAVAETGRPKRAMVVPLGPIKAVVRAGEAMRLPLPISSDNLQGLESVRTMETRPSLEKLGLRLTPFAEAMVRAVKPAPAGAGAGSPLRILLVGAGKIGIVHGLNLTRREGETLVGIVDRNPKAFKLYRTMGFAAPFLTDLDRALSDLKPDGAVIATPAATHLPLARRCLERGVAVLVEKPAAYKPELVAGLRVLQEQFGPTPCHTGYMAAQFPHLDMARQMLEEGEIGAVRGYHVFCLQSHIMAPKPVRWEMVREQSGGGVLVNFAGHWLAVMLRLFGAPGSVTARMWPIHSTEVEDAFEARFRHDRFGGRLFACWSAPGYARPENRIEIEGERGRIVVSQYFVSLERDGHTESMWTQQDFDTGYNSAPDYTGGGFAMEHANFARAIRAWRAGQAPPQGAPPSQTPVDFAEAARVEELIFKIYGVAETEDIRGASWVPAGAAGSADAAMDRIVEALL